MRLFYRRKSVNIPVKKLSYFGRFRGLMFRRRKTSPLLFDFGRKTQISFHSWLVFFPFLILWLDKKNQVVEWRVIRPFTTVIRAKNAFHKVVEIPIHPVWSKNIDFFVERGKI